MELDFPTITAIGAIVFVAALLQGASGFGFGLVVMGLLPLFLPIDLVSLTVPLILIPLLIVNFLTRIRDFRFREGALLFLGTFLGAIPGLLFLIKADESILRSALGVILIFVGIHDTIIRRHPPWIRGRIAQFVCGLLCGTLGGAFNTGGPPAIYWVYNQQWSLSQCVATLQATFLTTALTKLTLGSSMGLISRPMVQIFLVALLPLAAGLFTGIALSKKIPATAVRRGAFIFLGLLGVYFVVST